MTPAEANLHDIAATFCAPCVMRERCPQCQGAGKLATSTWDRPQMHIARCTACAGTGVVSRERVTP